MPEDAPLAFIAYALGPDTAAPALAPPGRAWMDATPHRFAYRCLPMVIANQAGWLILSPQRFTVTWSGGPDAAALTLDYPTGTLVRHACSHFGAGILTFAIGYLFRTSPGYNLLVRGPANSPKDGISALEGIVETDWSEATFTMNWQVTRRNYPIAFDEGEPIAMIVPMQRGALERFRPEIRALAAAPELAVGHAAWERSRVQHNADLRVPSSPAAKLGWQRHYVRGMTVTDQEVPEHQTALALAPFIDKR